ncbi:recombinase family protein, partial [Neobacillus vireti]|uniref:recombinase family protein n=1 Tax=Neobacillus vireti TaxID=220686 RepID=UPI003000C69B
MTVAIAREIKHVAMYLRISREKKGENVETLANHRSLLTDFTKKSGYSYEAFEEVLSGGASELEARPQLQELLDRIEEFDGILVVELSRLSRNGLISEQVLQHCVDYDKPIITPIHTYDLANNNNDVLTYRFGSLIASQEHALIGKRSKSNKIQMAKAGLDVSGGVPYGYRRNTKTKKLEIYEPEAEAVRLIFKLHSQGHGSFKIRDILNEEGIYKPSRTDHWNLPSIKRIIRNEKYKGWNFFNDRKKVKKNGKWVYETLEKIVVKEAHPPIIPEKEWDLANKDREERAKRAGMIREKPAVKSGVTSLKDLMICGCCGRKMTIRKDLSCATGYLVKKCDYLLDNGKKCNNSGIRLVHIEEQVLTDVMKEKERLELYLKSLKADDTNEYMDNLQKHLKQLAKRIKNAEAEDKKLIDLALTGIFSTEEIRLKKQEIIEKIKLLKDEKDSLMNELEKPKIEDLQAVLKGKIAIIDTLPSLEAEALNYALKTIIKCVTYTRIIPEDILKLSTRNPARKFYPF